MSFKCLKCRKIVDNLEDRVRCPYCGYRIFSKMRANVVKRVQTR